MSALGRRERTIPGIVGAVAVGAGGLVAVRLFAPDPRTVAVFTAGQVVEGVGAFGFDRQNGYVVVQPGLAWIHDASIVTVPVAALSIGAGLAVTSALWLASRRRPRARRAN